MTKTVSVTGVSTADKTAKKKRGENLKQYQFKPGVSPNPAGRPKGSRNKLGEAFVADLLASWQAGGPAVIKRVMAEEPGTYLKVVAGLLPKQLEIKDELSELTDEQLAALNSALSLLAAGYSSAPSEDLEGSETASRH